MDCAFIPSWLQNSLSLIQREGRVETVLFRGVKNDKSLHFPCLYVNNDSKNIIFTEMALKRFIYSWNNLRILFLPRAMITLNVYVPKRSALVYKSAVDTNDLLLGTRNAFNSSVKMTNRCIY